MSEQIARNLIGPFPMSQPPLRSGWYMVDLTSDGGPPVPWYWSLKAATWSDEDDGLGDPCPIDQAAGWYGLLGPES